MDEIQYEILPIIISKYISKSDTYFSVIFDLKLMDVNTALNVENSLSYTKKEEVLDNTFINFVIRMQKIYLTKSIYSRRRGG